MTKPESLPVEEARKKFADVLDGSQFRSTHTEITRRGKPAGYVVPPEWYAEAVEALTEKRDRTAASPSPVAATPRQEVTAVAADSPEDPGISPEVAALSYEQARDLFKDAETRNIQWAFRMRRTLGTVPPGRRPYLGVQAGVDEGLIDLPKDPESGEGNAT